MMKAGFGLCVAALALAGVTGCATKNYVKKQTAPLIDHTNQLDEKTATNNRNLHDVDDRAQAGIKQAQGAADSATQNAQNATKAAGDAENRRQRCRPSRRLARQRESRDWITTVPWANVTVTFGFDKAVLTKDDKEQLDNFGQQLGVGEELHPRSDRRNRFHRLGRIQL